MLFRFRLDGPGPHGPLTSNKYMIEKNKSEMISVIRGNLSLIASFSPHAINIFLKSLLSVSPLEIQLILTWAGGNLDQVHCMYT